MEAAYLKGLELGLRKIALHDMMRKKVRIVDFKGPASMLPGDDIFKALGIGVFQHSI
jgi:hypothetical protein